MDRFLCFLFFFFGFWIHFVGRWLACRCILVLGGLLLAISHQDHGVDVGTAFSVSTGRRRRDVIVLWHWTLWIDRECTGGRRRRRRRRNICSSRGTIRRGRGRGRNRGRRRRRSQRGIFQQFLVSKSGSPFIRCRNGRIINLDRCAFEEIIHGLFRKLAFCRSTICRLLFRFLLLNIHAHTHSLCFLNSTLHFLLSRHFSFSCNLLLGEIAIYVLFVLIGIFMLFTIL